MIIAEAGSNHDGNLERAFEYVRMAKEAGADAVKFQFLQRGILVSPKINLGTTQEDNPVYTGWPLKDVPENWIPKLKQYSDEVGIEFICTPFSLEGVDVLESVGVQTHKIASGDLTFTPLLEKVARTGKKVVLATGASDLDDVRKACAVLRDAGARDVVLLHCVSSYPPTWDEMNLRAMVTMAEEFGIPVGISDHSPGSIVPVAATALGATVIEKHVTTDRANPGPDHPYAMTFPEFAQMVTDVKNIRAALGDGVKAPSPAEKKIQTHIRRGIYDPETFRPAREGVWLRPEHRP